MGQNLTCPIVAHSVWDFLVVLSTQAHATCIALFDGFMCALVLANVPLLLTLCGA